MRLLRFSKEEPDSLNTYFDSKIQSQQFIQKNEESQKYMRNILELVKKCFAERLLWEKLDILSACLFS